MTTVRVKVWNMLATNRTFKQHLRISTIWGYQQLVTADAFTFPEEIHKRNILHYWVLAASIGMKSWKCSNKYCSPPNNFNSPYRSLSLTNVRKSSAPTKFWRILKKKPCIHFFQFLIPFSDGVYLFQTMETWISEIC